MTCHTLPQLIKVQSWTPCWLRRTMKHRMLVIWSPKWTAYICIYKTSTENKKGTDLESVDSNFNITFKENLIKVIYLLNHDDKRYRDVGKSRYRGKWYNQLTVISRKVFLVVAQWVTVIHESNLHAGRGTLGTRDPAPLPRPPVTVGRAAALRLCTASRLTKTVTFLVVFLYRSTLL